MRKSALSSLSLASLVLLGLVSASAQAASPGGCTGAVQYHNGRFLGYKLSSTDPMVGAWAGTSFANKVVNTSNNASAPDTGITRIQVFNNGVFEASGWSRYGKGALNKQNAYYGNVYCLAQGRAYAITADKDLAHRRSALVILNNARDTAFAKDVIASTSYQNGDHSMQLLTKLPTSTNMTDVWRLIDNASLN